MVKNSYIKERSLISAAPEAALSRRAPSAVFAVCIVITSVVISCNVGSTQTSLQTSVSRDAVRSLSSLWRMDGKSPFGQNSTCCA